MGLGGLGEEEGDPDNSSLPATQSHILTAQFECYMKINEDPPRQGNGTFCNRTWDGWLCWGDAEPGTVLQMCPEYFQDFDPAEKVTKVCNPDGTWFHHPESNRVWSNYTQCAAYTKGKLKVAYSLFYLALLGHGLSIISLLISLIIFSYFKSLSCQRVSLHKNMFMSFILNSVVTVIWLSTVPNNQELVASNPISCKVLSVVIQYTFASSYFWMLCQGIYLHTLIIVAVFVGEQQLVSYYILGWGFPIIPAVTYAVGRGMFYNDNCWISSNTRLLYIIHGPIHVALLVNLFFLLNIVRVLITKLRVTHSAETTAYMKVVRAILILIPLLGVQFILVPCRPTGRLAFAVYEFTMNIFSHFQGLLVAIIFCFCNSEAQTALRRKWAQWQIVWEKNPVHSNFHSSSHYCTSSFTMSDTGQAPISLKPSPPLVAPPPDEPRPLGPPPKELAQTNGQWRDGEAGPQQQKQQTPGISETTRV
ncbi:calcitonin gene-related peptide type 1 receptor-like [Gadus chalcogrammus]|uniref:calcitonin gene-related peptide type 1 receptor-like n=1 Tax=Gadus chalcogrammus TaxID=1042646 RepID=UPI0024C42EE8|nr:calcitonin gene-related peptide type 1 receptor-like [Gadus chalcogrammus]